MGVVPNLPKQNVGYGCGCRTELTKVSGTGMDVVPNLPKCGVRVWMSYRTYQRVGEGYGCFIKLTKGVGYGTAACTRTRTRPHVFQQGRTRYQGILQREYRTYQSVGYGYGCRTELTKGSGTGMEIVPSLPKCRVRVMQGVCTPCTLWYVPYRTQLHTIVFVSKGVEVSRKYPGIEQSILYHYYPKYMAFFVLRFMYLMVVRRKWFSSLEYDITFT